MKTPSYIRIREMGTLLITVVLVLIAGCEDKPQPTPKPKCPHCDKREREAAVLLESVDKITVGGSTAPDGKTLVKCDLPIDQRKRNISSKGLGCCVFRSLCHSARWQEVPQLWGMAEWMVEKGVPGGGYPKKVDDLVPRISKDRGMKPPDYLQYEGRDLSVLRRALATGRMPCVTYDGRDPHYSGTIAHMVNLVYLDEHQACILDNNFVDENELVWMSAAEFKTRWGGDGGWAVVLISPPPPPVPMN